MARDDRPPHRLLVALPKWIGDCTMATPTLRLIRRAFPGTFIGGLMFPGADALFAGSDFFDALHVDRPQGIMGHKHVASRLRPHRYDTAILLRNSLSTALTVRLAGIPRRMGFDRDGRGFLLTDRLPTCPGPGGRYGVVSYVDYVYTLARRLLLPLGKDADRLEPIPPPPAYLRLPAGHFMELATTPEEESHAAAVLAKAGIRADERLALLVPGGNSEAKRWPASGFAAIARRLVDAHAFRVLIAGSPGELDLATRVAEESKRPCVVLPSLGVGIGPLKAVMRRCALAVANDTGPRHMAAALGVPLLTFFGPNDYRWATIPTRPHAPEVMLTADPTLPESEIANDHPERCRIDRIPVAMALDALERLIALITSPTPPEPAVITRAPIPAP